mmetsp:Transcript_55629/g.125419  ORF Transcript_55629/g.125419 Transcript_55629/m.125419 type:complete len:210 (+) Transcript_55629:690-1319(+)
MSSCGPKTAATEEATRSRHGLSAYFLSVTQCSSGLLNGRGHLAPNWPSTVFHRRSPKERLTDESAPLACWMRTAPLSPTTLAPTERSRGMSPRSCCGPPPRGTATDRPPSSAWPSTAMQRPTIAVKTWSPMTRHTAAPQPSLMSVWLVRSSRSRSSKDPLSAASTEASSAGTGGSLERRSNSLLWKLRAQNSAAMGPGSPAQDCPSKTA